MYKIQYVISTKLSSKNSSLCSTGYFTKEKWETLNLFHNPSKTLIPKLVKDNSSNESMFKPQVQKNQLTTVSTNRDLLFLITTHPEV